MSFQGHPRKRKLFIAALIEGKNMHQASDAVGISRSTGWHWSQLAEVRDKVEKGLSDAAVYAGVSRAWVIMKLKEVAERCMQAQPVKVNGKETGLYVFDSSGANRALELIGKHLRVFGDDASATAQLGAAVIGVLAKEAQEIRMKKRLPASVKAEIIEGVREHGISGGEQITEMGGRSGSDGDRRIQGGEARSMADRLSEGVSASTEVGGDCV